MVNSVFCEIWAITNGKKQLVESNDNIHAGPSNSCKIWSLTTRALHFSLTRFIWPSTKISFVAAHVARVNTKPFGTQEKRLTIAYLMHLLFVWAGQRDAKETPVELCTRGQESLPQLCALKKAHDLHDNQGEKINKHVTFLIILDVCFMFLNVFWCFLTFVGCLLKGLKETHLSSRSSHIASSTLSTLSRAWNSLMGQPHLGIGQTSSCGNRWGKRHLEPK